MTSKAKNEGNVHQLSIMVFPMADMGINERVQIS
jgi:hypothetical protein